MLRRRSRGSVLVEAILSLPVGMLLVSFFLELARRPLYEAAAQWGSFSLARRALLEDARPAEKSIRKWLAEAVKLPVRRRVHQSQTAQHTVGQVRLRFASVQRFQSRTGQRHHFQLSRRCTFSFR